VAEAFLTLLLAVHLLLVNVAAGGPLVAAWLDWRGTRGEQVAVQAAAFLARAALIGLVAGGATGAVMGWLKWDAAYASLWLGPLKYKLHGAAIEFVFSLVLMLAWRLWLPRRTGGSRWAMISRCVLAVLAATNLMYHFPPLFSVAARLATSGATSGEQIGGAGFRRLMIAGETPALSIHVALASLATTGIVLLVLALLRLGAGDQAAAAKLARWGGRWALVPSILQLPVGLWTLTVMPAAAQSQLMGESTIGTLMLVSALAAALWLINDLVHISFGETKRALLIWAIVAMLATVVLMTAMQQYARPRGTAMGAVGHARRGVPRSGKWIIACLNATEHISSRRAHDG
jgi:hypothetical protein